MLQKPHSHWPVQPKIICNKTTNNKDNKWREFLNSARSSGLNVKMDTLRKVCLWFVACKIVPEGSNDLKVKEMCLGSPVWFPGPAGKCVLGKWMNSTRTDMAHGTWLEEPIAIHICPFWPSRGGKFPLLRQLWELETLRMPACLRLLTNCDWHVLINISAAGLCILSACLNACQWLRVINANV